MKHTSFVHAVSCVGAVIGAGFASGREMIVFFAQYGKWGGWLVLLSAGVMTALLALCMAANQVKDKRLWFSEAASIGLMLVTAGGMISAAGHIAALVLPIKWAYQLGALGSLFFAWLIARKDIQKLAYAGVLLIAVMGAALLLAAGQQPAEGITYMRAHNAWHIAGAAVKAVGYAAMNMTLAAAVAGSCLPNENKRLTAIIFDVMMSSIMLLSLRLYSKRMDSFNVAFPIIRLLSDYGKTGYLLSAGLLYLAIMTTLASLVFGLHQTFKRHWDNCFIYAAIVLLIPLLLSRVGFANIVDGMYAPAGLLCLFAVFLPLAARKRKQKRDTFYLDKDR